MEGGTVSIHWIARVVSVASLALSVMVGSGLMAPPASAAGTTTLHFYSVHQTGTFTDAVGQPISAADATPVPGDHVDTTDLDYVGNHKHHASIFTASDHLACTFTSATAATCSAQVAIGGSLLLTNDVTVALTQNRPPLPINAGTGKYTNARGTVTPTTVGNSNNSDMTITVTG
jgi:hypothetical protein